MDVKIVHDNIKFKLRVSGIIIEDNKILVEQYKEDEYCLPGGYVELNETTENAIKRELYEETKIKFKINRFFGTVENFFTNKRNERTHEIDFYYFLKGSNVYKNLKLDVIEQGEYSQINHHFKWIELDKLIDYNLVPEEIKKLIIKNDENNIHIVINE